MLKSEVLQNSKLDLEVSRYLTAILEYISMEILKLAVHYVIKIPHHCITRQDIKAAISIDKVRQIYWFKMYFWAQKQDMKSLHKENFLFN